MSKYVAIERPSEREEVEKDWNFGMVMFTQKQLDGKLDEVE